MSRIYLPNQFVLPEDDQEKMKVIQEYLEEIAAAVNLITEGSSKPSAPAPPAPAPPVVSTQTKTIDCGALPNRTSKFINHGTLSLPSASTYSI